jgi:hypothetical protein
MTSGGVEGDDAPEVVEGAEAVAAGIPAAEAAGVVDVGAAATGNIEDCRLTIFGLKSSISGRVFTES